MMLPDTAALSERLRVCLQEGDENPRDFTSLFDLSLYQLDTTSLPKVIKSVLRLSAALHSILSVRSANTSLGTGDRVTISVVYKTCSQTCDEVGRDSRGIGAGLDAEETACNYQPLLCSRLCIRHLEEPAWPGLPETFLVLAQRAPCPRDPLSESRWLVSL